MGEGELWLREQVDGSAAGFDEDLAGAGAERDQVVAPLQIEVEGGRRAKIPAARKVVDKKWLRREVILARAVVAAGEVGLPGQEPAKQAPVLGRDRDAGGADLPLARPSLVGRRGRNGELRAEAETFSSLPLPRFHKLTFEKVAPGYRGAFTCRRHGGPGRRAGDSRVCGRVAQTVGRSSQSPGNEKPRQSDTLTGLSLGLRRFAPWFAGPAIKGREGLLLPLEHRSLLLRQILQLAQRLPSLVQHLSSLVCRSAQLVGDFPRLLGQLPAGFPSIPHVLRGIAGDLLIVPEPFMAPPDRLGNLPTLFALTPVQFGLLAPPLGGFTGSLAPVW